jgi:radical SAM protein with 4Fe4S-binding SPASM domain
MSLEIEEAKKVFLDRKAEERARLFKEPDLIYLFFELTRSCNEKCFHCGSSCAPGLGHGPDVDAFKAVLDDVKEHFDLKKLQLCITGGEPLLYPGFAELLGYADRQGFRWGMTTNATLITKEVAKMLEDTGMGTVSVSIDGLRDTHDRQRGLKGGYDKAMQGIQNLIDRKAFRHIQVTTVVNHRNITELDELYEILDKLDLDSWRVIGIEPMGRALDYPELLLTPDDQRYLFNYIREKREQGIPVNYGCSHFLGLEYERDVRDWFFYCGAGTHTAAVRINGDITACLDIEERPEFVQGNIAKDKFSDVWFNRFGVFRKPLSTLCSDCQKCEWEKWCAGGSRHCFDYDNNKQRVCFKDILF